MSTHAEWTSPYHGHQHLKGPNPRRWATVIAVTPLGHATLLAYFEGCRMNPRKSNHPTVAAAKAAGEDFMRRRA